MSKNMFYFVGDPAANGLFVALISEEKLHWRSVEEIIYIYGLENGLSYKECADILRQQEIQDIAALVKDYKTVDEIDEDGFTEFVKKINYNLVKYD